MAEEINGGTSMDSTESRWVIQDEDEDASDLENFDADLRFRRHAGVVDSEDEDDNAEQAEGEAALVAKFQKLHEDLTNGFRNLEDETR